MNSVDPLKERNCTLQMAIIQEIFSGRQLFWSLARSPAWNSVDGKGVDTYGFTATPTRGIRQDIPVAGGAVRKVTAPSDLTYLHHGTGLNDRYCGVRLLKQLKWRRCAGD